VDETNPIIVEAQAHGTGSEQALRVPVVEATVPLHIPATVMPADAGSHSEDNVKELAGKMVEASICDNGYRWRDERDAGQAHHKEKPDPLWDKRPKEQKPRRCGPADFRLAAAGSPCPCPAGKRLYSIRKSHRPEAGEDRYGVGTPDDGSAVCYRGAGIRQPAPPQTAGSLHPRGRAKGDGQWKLDCLTHNIEKLAHQGYGQ
jgi:hypothetical protein